MAKGKPGIRMSQADRRAALDLASELLARRISNQKIKKSLTSKFGISPRTGDRIIAECLKAWADEDETRIQFRRTQARRSLESIIESSFHGDERWMGKDEMCRPIYRRIPDRKSAVAAMRLLARIDGVLDSDDRSAASKLLDSILSDLSDGIADDLALDLPDDSEA